MNNKSTNNPAPSPATQTPKAVSRPSFAATHFLTCALMFAFGMGIARHKLYDAGKYHKETL